MAASAKPGVWDFLTSVGCVFLMLSALVIADGRVRQRFSAMVTEASTAGVAGWTETAAAFGRAVCDAAREQSLEHSPLLVLSGVAIILLISMLRM